MTISVISFNIRCCDDPNGNSIAERAPRLATVTAPYNADIIGLQEFRPAWESYIEQYYGEQYDMFFKYRAEEPDKEASPILWRKDKFDCLKTGYFWLSDTPEVESRGWDERCHCYRMAIYVVLKEKETGKTFTVMNTHFGFGDDGQIKSADLIYDYYKKISDNPTFIVGDFNMPPTSAGYAAMTGHFIDVNAETAKDMSPTYHGYDPESPEAYHIDYCFIGENVTPINQKIMTEKVENKFPSDHYGLYITLDV